MARLTTIIAMVILVFCISDVESFAPNITCVFATIIPPAISAKADRPRNITRNIPFSLLIALSSFAVLCCI